MARRTIQKQRNIERMKWLYAQRAYSDIEMAAVLGIDRTTVYRTRRQMEEMGMPFYEEESGRYRLDPSALLSSLEVTPSEALALYLGGRRLQQQTRSHQVDVANALYKLSQALRRPLMGQLVRAAEVILNQEQDPEQRAVINVLMQGWTEGFRVRIRHRKLHGALRTYTVSPYVLEPAVWGDGIYLIGHSDYHEGLATFKTDRIVEVHLLPEPYTIPDDFDVHALLQHAWGIWHTDGEPVVVRLRFSRSVAPRVKESIWHPSQTIRDFEDGGCEWRAEVAEWREMVPWIRGWGANCEVLAPEALRTELAHMAQRLVSLYGVAPEARATPYYAHSENSRGERQDLVEHLQAVAVMASQFAAPFGAAEVGHYVGLWHDLGKFHPEWQRRLLEAERHEAETGRYQRVGIDHKGAGVLMLRQHTRDAGAAALVLQGHHGGLKTVADLKQWLGSTTTNAERALAIARAVVPEITPPSSLSLPSFVGRSTLKLEFFLRFIFSVLVDADALDTERHGAAWKSERRAGAVSLALLEQRLEGAQAAFGRPTTTVNRARADIYESCLRAADAPPGLFRLTVPPGGGKTRSAMAFALRHAQRHGMRRVVVAVPYMTITEQTAAVYRDIFEKECEHVVLEHHSAAAENERDDQLWQRLAAENWDAPIVVTTTVQLFESLFASRPARCRKVHRLANSIIVLDEAQTLPVHLLAPILDSLQQLCADYNTTVILSTATQPAWEAIPVFRDVPAREIVPQPERFFHTLKRVNYDWSQARTPLSWDEIAGLLEDERQALVVVNTKGDALALLETLGDPDALHLSTLLCGAHRRRVIHEVRRRLVAGEPCRLVATQVVEAGVDIDFPLVLRALGPLDSIIQAAGRANREGRLEQGRVVVFQPQDGKVPPGAYAHATSQTVTLLHDGPIDVEDPATLRAYYRLWYGLENADRYGIQQSRQQLLYPAVAEAFRMIEDDTVGVVVTTYGTEEERRKVRRLVDELQSNNGPIRLLLRRLQPYLVSLRRREAEKHWRNGLIVPLTGDGELGGVGEWLGAYGAGPDLVGGHGLVAGDRDIADFVS